MRNSMTILAAALALSALATNAWATPHVSAIFDSTGQTAATSQKIPQTQAIAASFVTPGFAGGINSLTLDLVCATCGTGQTGSFTVSLNANSGATAIPGSVNPIADVPGTSLGSFTVSDAHLLTTTGPQLYMFANPFGALELTPDTAYWITVVGNSTLNTKASWELVAGGGGTGVVGNYFNAVSLYSHCGPLTACSFSNYSSTTPTPPAWQGKALGMKVEYVPEPASLAVLATGLLSLGLRRRRRPASR